MKKSKLLLGMLMLFFVVIVVASIFTLSVKALDNGHSEDNGKWDEVCCGSMCKGGHDYCLGTGTNTCCK